MSVCLLRNLKIIDLSVMKINWVLYFVMIRRGLNEFCYSNYNWEWDFFVLTLQSKRNKSIISVSFSYSSHFFNLSSQYEWASHRANVLFRITNLCLSHTKRGTWILFPKYYGTEPWTTYLKTATEGPTETQRSGTAAWRTRFENGEWVPQLWCQKVVIACGAVWLVSESYTFDMASSSVSLTKHSGILVIADKVYGHGKQGSE